MLLILFLPFPLVLYIVIIIYIRTHSLSEEIFRLFYKEIYIYIYLSEEIYQRKWNELENTNCDEIQNFSWCFMIEFICAYLWFLGWYHYWIRYLLVFYEVFVVSLVLGHLLSSTLARHSQMYPTLTQSQRYNPSQTCSTWSD